MLLIRRGVTPNVKYSLNYLKIMGITAPERNGIISIWYFPRPKLVLIECYPYAAQYEVGTQKCDYLILKKMELRSFYFEGVICVIITNTCGLCLKVCI